MSVHGAVMAVRRVEAARPGVRGQVVSGAADGFADVYSANVGPVFRFLLALTRDRDLAEDLTAEVFERAYRAWSRDEFPEERAPQWLLSTGRHLAVDRWRRARRLASALLRLGLPARQATDHAKSEFLIWLDSISMVLSSRQREALLLRYRNDLSDEVIGEILGISGSGVRSLVSRAIAVLRSHEELL